MTYLRHCGSSRGLCGCPGFRATSKGEVGHIRRYLGCDILCAFHGSVILFIPGSAHALMT
jgi:hypothetical protein